MPAVNGRSRTLTRNLTVVALAILALACPGDSVLAGQGGASQLTTPRIVDIWGGAGYYMALKDDGTVWTWGWNDYGVLGNGAGATMSDNDPTARQLFPRRVLGPGGIGHLTSILAVAGGERHAVALDSDGAVWTWGWNFLGQLGTGAACPDMNSGACMGLFPSRVPGLANVRAIAARGYHTLALKQDGTVWAWGFNDAGQVGDGTNIDRHTPVQVAGLTGHGGVAEIVSGGKVNVAIMADRTLMAWGRNAEGAVGNGAFDASGQGVPTATPVSQATGLTRVRAVAVGWNHVVALDTDGGVWTWGENTDGELGDGTTSHRNTPYRVPGLSGVTAVSAGDGHTEVAKEDGTVWSWGSNANGQLGDGKLYARSVTPVQAIGIDHVVLVRARNWNAAAIKADGSVWVWGDNGQGQCGNGLYSDNRTLPVQVVFPWLSPRVVSIWGGARHGLVLKSDGTVWDWGINMSGLLGDNTVSTFPPTDPFVGGTNDRHLPIQVHGPGDVGYLASIVAVMGGEPHNFALKADGTVWSWGSNMFGQLGDGTTVDRPTPVQVSGLTKVNSLGGRGYHSLAVRSDGTLWTWGYNSSGQLGNGTLTNSSVPVPVTGLTGVVTVTGGYIHSLALMSDHTLRAWGGNPNGQLGDGTFTYRTTPVPVPGLANVAQISAGWNHSMAVLGDGTVWTWGNNGSGKLGDGTTTNRATPGPVAGLDHVVAVSGGDCHSAALRSDGTVWTWGCNDRGQLGDGTDTDRYTPVMVVGLGDVVQLTARDYHNLALRSDGTVWSWGWNVNGQLGDGTTTTRNVPVQVLFPPPVYRRYFAEGAATSFFDTYFALLNVEDSTSHVTMRFLKDDGTNAVYALDVPAGTRRTVSARDVPGLVPAPGFSTIVESDVPVAADRTLSWGADGYGAHAETAIEAPALTWYLAEGSTLRLRKPDGTIVPFNLYYLIGNPNDQAVDVQITYLRPSPLPPLVKTYTVRALSRRTIWVPGEDPGLASTDVSGIVSSLSPSRPIIVERALYLDAQGVFFKAGHDAAGVTEPSTDWFLAEGATGPAFDEYVLVANPNATSAELDVTYLLTGGGTLVRHYTVSATSRRTIWVNGEQGGGISLAIGSVSTRVHVTNGIPVIVERAMWWPRPGWEGWYEAHCSPGATTTGTAWAVADGEQGGVRNTQTYVLIANTSAFEGRVRVTLVFEDGSSVAREFDVASNSRTTVYTGGASQTPGAPFGGLTAGRRFGALVESLDADGGQPARIVVERAMYWDAGGRWWSAGTNALGTKLR
jgi:alpha-tubulin suppressor-like RCC1 family protein